MHPAHVESSCEASVRMGVRTCTLLRVLALRTESCQMLPSTCLIPTSIYPRTKKKNFFFI